MNFNKLTIAQFLKCKTIADLEDDPLQKKIKLLAAVTNRTVDQVESLSIEKLTNELKTFSEIENLLPSQKIKLNFMLKGKRFKVIWQTQKLTSSQYIDATHFCKDSENIVHNIHNILASISIETTWYGKDKPYDGTKHKEIADLILNNMKIEAAYPIMLFFCKYYKELQNNILSFLELQAQKELKKVQPIMRALQADMVGKL